ncbi:GATA zinc finger domain-containing 7 [Fusarium acutatum]|uniref:GATA zinc finger domain-containing 7 n=1 Tax=Fusarium acutatum TaxID=78861 RepID=A0A8H4K5A7_9HYPO|nr:GATA zinc finger domain-containing 7 [Fusarium acutatum]
MCYSLTSTTIPCPSSLSEPIDATVRCTRPRCQQRRASRTRAKSSSNSPKRRSKHERSHLECTDHSSECVGHPLGNVPVFQTSAIASALTNDTEPPYGKCHTDTPCYINGDQESSHSMLHKDKAMSKSEGLEASHKKTRRQSHPPKHQHHQRQDLRLWQANFAQPITMSCKSCQAEETPRWRNGPAGPRTLCNFCGLIYAKRQQKYHDAPSSHCFSSD